MSRKKSDIDFMVRRREYVRQYRLRHPEKVAADNKRYRQNPIAKEKHRKYMAEWRRKHPERALEISRKNYKLNGKKHNAKKRIKYWSDPKYLKQVRDAEKRYKASGRRSEIHKRRYAEKIDELKAKSLQWKRDNRERVRAYVKMLRAKVLIHKERKQRAELDDRYVVKVITKSLDYKIKPKDIPKELIEIERIKIFTHRKLKQKI